MQLRHLSLSLGPPPLLCPPPAQVPPVAVAVRVPWTPGAPRCPSWSLGSGLGPPGPLVVLVGSRPQACWWRMWGLTCWTSTSPTSRGTSSWRRPCSRPACCRTGTFLRPHAMWVCQAPLLLGLALALVVVLGRLVVVVALVRVWVRGLALLLGGPHGRLLPSRAQVWGPCPWEAWGKGAGCRVAEVHRPGHRPDWLPMAGPWLHLAQPSLPRVQGPRLAPAPQPPTALAAPSAPVQVVVVVVCRQRLLEAPGPPRCPSGFGLTSLTLTWTLLRQAPPVPLQSW